MAALLAFAIGWIVGAMTVIIAAMMAGRGDDDE